MKTTSLSSLASLMLFTMAFFGGFSCSPGGPEPINYGEDTCARCRMTIIDQQFGAELITSKGKIYKFDSIECLAAYYIDKSGNSEDVHSMWVTDFMSPPSFLNASDAAFVHTSRMQSPMAVGLFAFATAELAAQFAQEHEGETLGWEAVNKLVATEWSLE